MDYLQNLELQMMALQRKVRLLEDLKSFADTASREEIQSFVEALRAIPLASGQSLGSLFAASVAGHSIAAVESVRAEAVRAEAVRTEVAQTEAMRTEAAQTEAAQAVAVAPSAEALAVEFQPGKPFPGDLSTLFEGAMKDIPGGSFMMGSESVDDEKPVHKVSLDAYRLCDHLVTNKEYSLFVEANPHWAKDRAESDLRDDRYLEEWGDEGYPEGKDDNPVAFVSYFAAQAFAEWVGKRLPTEAEWERAARGGLVGKKFPNGDQMNDKLANLAKQYRGTTPVRKFEPNGFGLYDMAGNLFEWCSDWYGPYPPGEASSPKGPSSGDYRVVRGGSWMSGANALRVSARVDMESQTCGQVGIRLADDGA